MAHLEVRPPKKELKRSLLHAPPTKLALLEVRPLQKDLYRKYTYKYYMALGKGDMGDFRNLVQMVCDNIIKGYNLV